MGTQLIHGESCSVPIFFIDVSGGLGGVTEAQDKNKVNMFVVAPPLLQTLSCHYQSPAILFPSCCQQNKVNTKDRRPTAAVQWGLNT